jgi:hypothetical protein
MPAVFRAQASQDAATEIETDTDEAVDAVAA